jgi:hypothetical protein
MQFNPKALLMTMVFLVLLWLAITQEFSLLAVALDALLGWGLLNLTERSPVSPGQTRA